MAATIPPLIPDTSTQWMLPMRRLLVVCFLVLGLLADGTAFAQSGERPKRSASASPAGKSAEEIRAINERVAAWLKTCLTDWDPATHLTKREWKTTCNRVAAERGQFLREDPDSMSIRHKTSAALISKSNRDDRRTNSLVG